MKPPSARVESYGWNPTSNHLLTNPLDRILEALGHLVDRQKFFVSNIHYRQYWLVGQLFLGRSDPKQIFLKNGWKTRRMH